jgi:hypothetical protein
VLIPTTFGLDDYVYDTLRAGASGFMLKDAPPEEIAAAVRIVASGDALLAPAVTARSSRSSPRIPARPQPTRSPPRKPTPIGIHGCGNVMTLFNRLPQPWETAVVSRGGLRGQISWCGSRGGNARYLIANRRRT